MKKIIIIGSGMGGLATGIYGQRNGFSTNIFEAHSLPGGQCTSWNRKGYIFDPCIHSLNGFKRNTKINSFWQELGAMPCETAKRNEFVSAFFPDGTCVHQVFNIEKLESHLKKIAPEDTAVINKFIQAIKSFITEFDWFGISNLGSPKEKLLLLFFMLPRIKLFRYTMGSFARQFKNRYLREMLPFVRNSLPDVPLFGYLAEFSSGVTEDILWPKGGSLTLSQNMAAHYQKLGGTIHFKKSVVKILTEKNRACGVELEDGTRHYADFIVSNADGRKTIMNLLNGKYTNKKVTRFCKPYPENNEIFAAVCVYLGVKRDLSAFPSSLIMFLDQPEVIVDHTCNHLHMQIYGFDTTMAPPGKGVIKVELFGKPSFFNSIHKNTAIYKVEKEKVAEQVITLLEKQMAGLRQDIEVVDVTTLHTWERYMGGTQGHHNYPRKYEDLTDIRNVLDFMFGLNRMFKLPGLKNFFFAGQWVTSMGSLFSNALTGRTVVKRICKQCGVRFTPCKPCNGIGASNVQAQETLTASGGSATGTE